MDCLTSFENSSLLDVTSPYAYSADKKPVFNEGARVYTPELCHDFATTFVRCAAGVIAYVKPAALFSFASHKSCSSCASLVCTDSVEWPKAARNSQCSDLARISSTSSGL